MAHSLRRETVSSLETRAARSSTASSDSRIFSMSSGETGTLTSVQESKSSAPSTTVTSAKPCPMSCPTRRPLALAWAPASVPVSVTTPSTFRYCPPGTNTVLGLLSSLIFRAPPPQSGSDSWPNASRPEGDCSVCWPQITVSATECPQRFLVVGLRPVGLAPVLHLGCDQVHRLEKERLDGF